MSDPTPLHERTPPRSFLFDGESWRLVSPTRLAPWPCDNNTNGVAATAQEQAEADAIYAAQKAEGRL